MHTRASVRVLFSSRRPSEREKSPRCSGLLLLLLVFQSRRFRRVTFGRKADDCRIAADRERFHFGGVILVSGGGGKTVLKFAYRRTSVDRSATTAARREIEPIQESSSRHPPQSAADAAPRCAAVIEAHHGAEPQTELSFHFIRSWHGASFKNRPD